ncbi:tetratricopeptide repeat protein [Sneathiella chinensis]|uniref:Tetratricopeptide repeat protein n=2 Tax=Sneathiella chinensis TaxID=349750 RepID=A0ABQ5U6K2_9PROT|nr:hypothetical protein [Sneathiella chinensis]GLQ06942.1 hypothetical protein GCM10007924_21630 [Sneathiella chinensis]
MFKFSRGAIEGAGQILSDTLAFDPDLSEGYSWFAFLKSVEIGQGFSDNPEADREQISSLILKALELDPYNDTALAIAGHLEAFIHHDFESALDYFDRALKINLYCAYAWGFSAITHCYMGKAEEALEMLSKSRKMMPFDPHPYYFDTARCIAYMLGGWHEEAAKVGLRVLRNNPNFYASYRPLISSLGHLGRQEEVEPILEKLKGVQPEFSVEWHLANYPPLDEETAEEYVKGLRLAGVSEE